MAGGASWLRRNDAVSILHAARGLTNSAGAIGALNRNEAGCVHIVGLPSSNSQRFLPPHAEPRLIETVGRFSLDYFELKGSSEICDVNYVGMVAAAFEAAAELPGGPVLLGVPQDVSEERWIDSKALKNLKGPAYTRRPASINDISPAIDYILSARKISIIVDDFALKHTTFQDALNKFSQSINSNVFQVKYRRGPMLFQYIDQNRVEKFSGYLSSAESWREIQESDLIITIEDRNMYSRVIGEMPLCNKIAITSNVRMTSKNAYLNDTDIIIEGDPEKILESFSSIKCDVDTNITRGHLDILSLDVPVSRILMVSVIADFLATIPSPTVVDDSQMFGGLLSNHIELLPKNLRIIGDHSGFVGGGMAFACGFAMANIESSVVCLVGDQGFINGIQSLVAYREYNVNVVIIVCDNGRSVSLLKQLGSLDSSSGERKYLENPAGFSHAKVAEGFGIASWSVSFRQPRELLDCLRSAFSSPGPSLVHVMVDAESEFWTGVWETKGLDEE